MTRTSPYRLILIIALPLLATTATHAAKMPAWTEPYVERHKALLQATLTEPYRFLLSESRLEVQEDGMMHIEQRTAAMAFTDEPDGMDAGHFHYSDETTEIQVSQGWHVPARGRAEKGRRTPLDLTVDDSFLTDQKARIVTLDDVARGSLAFFEFKAIERPDVLSTEIRFGEAAPVERARFELAVPDGWKVRWAWLRDDGPDPKQRAGTWIWEISDLAIDLDRENVVEHLPTLVISFTPPTGIRVHGAPVPDWLAFARWYERLSEGRHQVTEKVRAAAEEASVAGDERLLVLRRTGNWVRDRVRYVDKEFGIGSFQPRPADQVLDQLYGDCKDKGTLFRSLLAAHGILSYPVLVHTRFDGTVDREIPVLSSFNHYIVAVPLPSDEEVPAPFRPAVVRTEGLGDVLVVDTTNEYASIGSLPAYLGGRWAFMVAGEQSQILELPAGDPEAHRIERQLHARRRDDGSVAVTLTRHYFGEPAEMARARYRRSRREYADDLRTELRSLWRDATIEEPDVAQELEDGRFRESAVVLLQPGMTDALRLFPAADNGLRRVSLSRREEPVVYEHAITMTFDSQITGLAQTPAPPPNEEFDGDGWQVMARYEADGNTFRGVWRTTLTRQRFEPDSFRELRRLWTAMDRSTALAIPL